MADSELVLTQDQRQKLERINNSTKAVWQKIKVQVILAVDCSEFGLRLSDEEAARVASTTPKVATTVRRRAERFGALETAAPEPRKMAPHARRYAKQDPSDRVGRLYDGRAYAIRPTSTERDRLVLELANAELSNPGSPCWKSYNAFAEHAFDRLGFFIASGRIKQILAENQIQLQQKASLAKV
jgi:hypothetical protein